MHGTNAQSTNEEDFTLERRPEYASFAISNFIARPPTPIPVQLHGS